MNRGFGLLLGAWLCAWLVACGAPGAPGRAELTVEERAFLDTHRIRLAPDPAFPPIEWFDERGEYRGLAADYVRLIEQRLGTKIEIVRLSSWEEVLAKARSREVDGITAAQPTEDRAAYLSFTPPILDIPNVVIVRKDARGDHSLEALRGRRVAVTRGYALEEYLQKQHPDVQVAPQHDDLTCLHEVAFGRADATVVNLAIASYLIEKHGITNLRVAGDSGRSNPLAIAVRSDEPVLRSILAKGLAAVTPEEREAIRSRWIRFEAGPFSREVFVALAVGAGVVGLGALVAFAWTWTLRRRVARATAALQQELAERHRVEGALRESQRKLALHHEQSLVGVVEFDAAFRVVSWNAAAERIFGWKRDEVAGVEAAERLFPAAGRDEARRAFANLLVGAGGRYAVVANHTADGRLISCEWHYTALATEQGCSGAIALVLDVTERERREEVQARAQRLESLAMLAGGIAHDFNNLLTGVLGNLSLALTDRPEAEELRELLTEAEQAAQRAQGLTRQLLTFARGGAPVRALLDVAPVVREAALFAARGSSGACRCSLTPDAWPVEGDAGQLGQVVQNLVLNALEAAPGGTVEVGLENRRLDQPRGALAAGAWVCLRVADRGPGISPADLPHLFDPFFSTKRRGSGLGLAVTHSIVTRHGGQVEVSSKPGEGATFEVFLPGRPGERPSDAVLAKAPESGRRARILLMDDEESVRRVAVRVFEGAGWEVAAVADGEEAVARYRAEREAGRPFDVVVLDLTVPGRLGGVETLAALREVDPQVRAIVSSGYSTAAELSDHRAHGFLAVIPKPWTVSEARRVVAEVLSGVKPT